MTLSDKLSSRASPSPSAKSSRFSIRPSTTSNGRFSMLRPSSPMWGASAPAPAAPSTPAASPTTLVTAAAAAAVEAPSPTSPLSAPLYIRCKCELNEEDLAAAAADAQQPPSTPANQVTNLPVASAYVVPASPASPSPRNLVQRATKRLSIDLLTRRSARPLDNLKTDDISSSTGLGLELGEAAAVPTASVSLDTQHQQVAAAATPTRSPAKKLAGWLRRSPSTLLSSLPSPALTSSPLSLKRATSPSLFDVPSDPFSATPTTPTGELRRSRAVSLSASVGLEVGWREEEVCAADRVSTATYDTILSRTQARPATPPAHALRASRSLGALSALDAKQQQQQQRKGAAYKKIDNNVDSDTDVHSLSSSTATSSEYGHPTEYSPSPSSSACSDAFEFDEYAEYLRYGGGLDSHAGTAASSDEEEESSTSDDDDESNASDETTTADSPLIKQRMRLHHNSVTSIVNGGSNGENELNTVPFPLTPPAPRQLLLFSRLSPSNTTNGGEVEEGSSSPIEESSFTSFNSRVIPLTRRSTKQLARASTPVTQGYALKPLPAFPNDSTSAPTATTTMTKRGTTERPRTAMDLSTIRPSTHLKPLILHAPSASASAAVGLARSPSRTVGYGAGAGAGAGRGYARPALTPPVGLRQMRSRARALSTDA